MSIIIQVIIIADFVLIFVRYLQWINDYAYILMIGDILCTVYHIFWIFTIVSQL